MNNRIDCCSIGQQFQKKLKRKEFEKKKKIDQSVRVKIDITHEYQANIFFCCIKMSKTRMSTS